MFGFFRTRTSRLIATLAAAAILTAPSADAQRKKPKKRPAATAKPKHAPAKAAPGAAPAPAPGVAAPEEDPEPMPPPKKGKPDTEPEEPAPAADPSESGDKGVDRDKGVEKDKDAAGKPPSLLDLEVGIKGFQRHLVYQGDINNVLPDYDLGGAPAIALDFGFYPIRTATGGIAAGVTGGFESGFSMNRTYPEPMAGLDGTHATTANAYSVGARVNFNFGH